MMGSTHIYKTTCPKCGKPKAIKTVVHYVDRKPDYLVGGHCYKCCHTPRSGTAQTPARRVLWTPPPK